MEVGEILEECRDLVEQVCAKFDYDSQDTEGNDSLKTVLLKVIPAMLKDSKKEDRNLFYQMLSHTPIVITENLSQKSYDRLVEEYIGSDVNPHIIEEDVDLGEYGKALGAGAYVSEPIIDPNMHLQGKRSFIYIQRVTREAKELFGTDINVSHLIHELGHAWHAEDEEFVMQPDGTLRARVGTAEYIYSFSATQDNKFIMKCARTTGLMIEESMNTIAEEKAMANYMGISLEEMRKHYRETLVPSNYQGYMADLMGYMLEKLGKDDFENYRLHGEPESLNRINGLMEQTDYWENREKDISAVADGPRSYDKKRAVIGRIDNMRVQEFFKEYETIYFPDISKMTPIEKIDNVLTQKYNLNMVRFNMGIDNYKALLERISWEGYPLINQAADLKKRQELSYAVSDDTSSELSTITGVTGEIPLEGFMAVQNIDYYIEEVKKGHIDGGGGRTKAYMFKDDNVILVQKYEKDFAELKDRIKRCKLLGINIPAYIDYKTDDDGNCWILEQLAKGKELASLVNDENGRSIISNIPYEHIEKYLRDVYLLSINGIGVEPRRRNIFYDETEGFTTIDVSTKNPTENFDSLEKVSKFFNMYAGVCNISLPKDENNKSVKEKMLLNILRAFENSHPFFNKYKRWIYRGSQYWGSFVEEQGVDLTLDSKEYEELTKYIDELINGIVNEKINCPENFGNSSHASYIETLEASIAYCPNFTLYDTNNHSLEEYINHLVYERIKSLFFENGSNSVLRNLYYKIRKKEIDPLNIYEPDQVTEEIEQEIKEYFKKHSTQEIPPEEALKNALRQGTTTEQVNQVMSVELSSINPETQEKGEEKDD